MKHSQSIALLLALGATAAGCATDPPRGDDDGGGGGPGSAEVPRNPEGKYSVTSDYDIATNVPGTAGAVINGFIAATDDPDDPSKWILEQLAETLPNGSVKDAVKGVIPFAAGTINDKLLEFAPDFVPRIVKVGDSFGQIARHFGTMETLDVNVLGQGARTVTGVQFTVDELQLQYAFKDYNLANVAVPVMVAVDQTGRLTISEHRLPISYGAVLRLALDEVIIPIVDPTAVKLEDILDNVVNCQKVGVYLHDHVSIGSASTFEAACHAGLKAGAHAAYSAIAKIDDSALEFAATGVAKGIDRNKDGKMDLIQTGAWTGTLNYGNNASPLARGTFIGQRL